MAQLYTIKCPVCGEEFNVGKGITMNWDPAIPIPEQAKEETPFNCPKCGRKMCVLDDDFNENVTSVLFVD